MGSEIGGLSAGDVDGINVGIGEADFQAICVQSFAVGTPGDRAPKMVWRVLMREKGDFTRGPVEQGDIVYGGFFWFVVEGDGFSVRRPAGGFFPDVGRVGQIDYFAAVAGDSEQVPEFVSGGVL